MSGLVGFSERVLNQRPRGVASEAIHDLGLITVSELIDGLNKGRPQRWSMLIEVVSTMVSEGPSSILVALIEGSDHHDVPHRRTLADKWIVIDSH